MAESISSWLAKAVVSHDEKHGANLEKRIDNLKRLVQIKKFHTFRTEADPERQITGLVSDRTHDLLVEFDVEATDRFESPDTDLPRETLTSNLRSIVIIRSYRWKLEPPSRRRSADGNLELPVVKMVILDFELHSGSKDSPIFYEDTCEIGKGKNDGPVQRVLRKWYFGESNSDPSQQDKSFDISQSEAGPSRLRPPPVDQNHTAQALPEGVISLSTFLEPYLAEDGSKRGRTIPEWIFKTSAMVEAALDEVQVFGLDFDGGSDVAAPVVSSAESASMMMKERAIVSSGHENERPQAPNQSSPTVASRPDLFVSQTQTQYTTPPVPLGQRARSPQTHTQPEFGSREADDEESDGEIPIRPIGGSSTQRRPIFDPLSFSSQPSEPSDVALSPAANTGEVEEEEEIDFVDDATTDSEQLSDYERSARQERKRRLAIEAADVKPEVKAEPAQDEESMPASESVESYSLSKQFPSPSKRSRQEADQLKPLQSSDSAPTQHCQQVSLPVVVGHGASQAQEHDSLESNKTGSGATQSLPTPPPSDDQPYEPQAAKKPGTEQQQPPAQAVRRATLDPDVKPTSHTIEQQSAEHDASLGTPDFLKLDLTVDGLTEATVQDYTRKVREKRAAALQRRRTSETPRNFDR